MKCEIVPHAGWNRNLLLSNEHAEVVVTLDVGPRVLEYRRPGGTNVFKTYEDQLGGCGESEWMIRGGHRLWVAPESTDLTYHLDNFPVEHRVDEGSGEVCFDTLQPQGIFKTLRVGLADGSSCVTVRHILRNDGGTPIEVAAWGLSVMAPGGLLIVPQPPLGQHPRDLLPNRCMVLWPYTDLSDPRIHLGRDFFTLRQSEGFPPAKFGLSHREKWVAYILGDTLFLKSFDHIPGAVYPDGGCNFETFTNDEMLEVESLSPLVTLQPGDSIGHDERWHLLPIREQASIESETDLRDWLNPFLKHAGLTS